VIQEAKTKTVIVHKSISAGWKRVSGGLEETCTGRPIIELFLKEYSPQKLQVCNDGNE